MDATGADQIWTSLGDAIDEIHHRNASSLSFEELYRNAYNLVLHKHGELLYSGVSDRLATHLIETVQRLAEVPDSSLLEEMAHAWSEREYFFFSQNERYPSYSFNDRLGSTNLLYIASALRLATHVHIIFSFVCHQLHLKRRSHYNGHGARYFDVHGSDVCPPESSSASL